MQFKVIKEDKTVYAHFRDGEKISVETIAKIAGIGRKQAMVRLKTAETKNELLATNRKRKDCSHLFKVVMLGKEFGDIITLDEIKERMALINFTEREPNSIVNSLFSRGSIGRTGRRGVYKITSSPSCTQGSGKRAIRKLRKTTNPLITKMRERIATDQAARFFSQAMV